MKPFGSICRQIAGSLVSSKRSVRTSIGLAIVLTVIFAWGSRRVAAIATQPIQLSGSRLPNSLPGPRFRVGSFNIHGGKGRDGRFDLGRTTQLLGSMELDVVGLYEVHGNLCGLQHDQARLLGDRLQMGSVFAPTERRYWHDHFGNGLLSRAGLTSLQRVPLVCTQGKRYRCAVLTDFRVAGRTVHLLAVHVDRVKDREEQLRAVFGMFLSLEEPAVLMGDLNTLADDEQLGALLARSDVLDAVAEGSDGHHEGPRIDWILTRGLRVVAAGAADDGSSDHPLVWAELELSGTEDHSE